ncbi:MAG: DUF4392 domain-containing protein [Firmicutes bacterium]|nr:DUF4392 domain-containing protein [Bacillota bacterium]
MDKYIEKIIKIIETNLDRRGMNKISSAKEFKSSTKELLKSTTVFIVTGFPVKDALIGETDGPIGAISLAKALEKLGKKVIIITDSYSKELLETCSKLKDFKGNLEIINKENAEKTCDELIKKYNPSHIVAVERPSKAKDNRFYSMTGEDITEYVANTDTFFNNSNSVTIAIGDGGNEIGMGKIYDHIKREVKFGEKICAVTKVDHLIVSGVSNWGAHGLVAAISVLTNKLLLHDCQREYELLKGITEIGSVDGYTKKNTLSVDGFSLESNLRIIEKLITIFDESQKQMLA